VAGRLGQLDVAADGAAQQDVAEVRADVVQHLAAEVRAAVVPAGEQARDAQPRVQPALHQVHDLRQLGQALQREELGLHRHEDLVAQDQGVEREQPEAGRAVHQDVVPARAAVGALVGLEGVAQDDLAAHDVDQLQLRARQVHAAGQHAEPRLARGAHGLLQRGLAMQDLVHRDLLVGGVHVHVHRQVALRVEVADQHAAPEARQAGAEVHGRGGLAHPALLVDDRDAPHRNPA
jgi:hypothetical protein